MTESVQGLKTSNNKTKDIKICESIKLCYTIYQITQTTKEDIMQTTIIFILLALITTSIIILAFHTYRANIRITNINKTLEHQYNLLVKIQSILKNKSATNAVAEHAEMIYQDLLQNLIPIMAAIDIMPRNTPEHALWRAIGGIMDEYAKNPFALEKLRRAIKLDSEVVRNIDNYIRRADNFLHHLSTTETDGLLSSTFTDGLLGQSLTFFAQAKQLANQSD